MSDNIIQLNEDLIKHDLRDLVRSSVEETLNALLDKEADELVNAQKYERSSERQGYRSGHYKRNFQTPPCSRNPMGCKTLHEHGLPQQYENGS